MRPDRLERSMQSPEGRRIYPEVNVRSSGALAEREILVDVGKRMGRGHGGTPRLLRNRSVRVNSKAFLIGTGARSVATELFLDKNDNERFDQVGGNARHAQEKTGFQQAGSSFANSFWCNVNLLLASNNSRHEQTERHS